MAHTDRSEPSAATVAAYALPVGPANFLFVLTYIYFVKFSTDVLLVPAASIALVFGLSRLWDAISDPMAGFLSDRTRARSGRRRSWILSAAVPMALAAWMLWSPPSGLQGGVLLAWLTLGLLAFSTAYTAFEVPHNALGAELSDRAVIRARLFGARAWMFMIGSYSALTVGIATIRTAAEPRSSASALIAVVGLLAVLVMTVCTLRLRERPEYADRGARSPLRAYRDVLRNRHARLVLLVILTEYVGSGGAAITIAYVFDYVLAAPQLTEVNFVAIGAAQLISIPIWVRLVRRMEKKHLWRIAMALSALGCLLQFLSGLHGWVTGFLVGSFLFGLGASSTNVMGSAVLADVIDSDELETGERKEGAYFASWHFVRKLVQASMLVVVGVALEVSGFRPNVEQTQVTRLTILCLGTLAPCIGYTLAFAVFSRYRLTGETYDAIRAELDRRATLDPSRR